MEFKYDTIGNSYNSTRRADPYIASRLVYHLQPQSDKLYLDIGCGTGNYTRYLADQGLRFTGVDPSEKMLAEARLLSQSINWLQGTAEQIPVGNGIFNGAIATLTIHHWTDLTKAFREISRVLCDEARLVLFTSTPEQMRGYWLNHYFPDMLDASIVQMPSLEDINNASEGSRLKISTVEKYFIKDDLQDCFLYVGKNRPECYFDEEVRRGISSFSSLANSKEVTEGLRQLKTDLDNHIFEKIKGRYENDNGDYLFVIVEKDG